MGEQCSPLRTNNIIANNIKLRCDLIIDNFSPFINFLKTKLLHLATILPNFEKKQAVLGARGRYSRRRTYVR